MRGGFIRNLTNFIFKYEQLILNNNGECLLIDSNNLQFRKELLCLRASGRPRIICNITKNVSKKFYFQKFLSNFLDLIENSESSYINSNPTYIYK